MRVLLNKMYHYAHVYPAYNGLQGIDQDQPWTSDDCRD